MARPMNHNDQYCLTINLHAIFVSVTSPACFHKTTNGQCCRIPFKYKGVTYHSCTSRDHDRPWCSLTRRFNQKKGKKHDCGESADLSLALRKLQAVNAAASRSNTRERHMIPAQWWMAIGLVLPQPPPCSIKTTTGECCSIPFKYKGKTYDSCTLVDLNTPWCSLDPVYNGTRGNCGKYSCYTELLFGNNYEQ
ncbi:hypothetical protein P5673_020511, partial [Acropora cervicornis]